MAHNINNPFDHNGVIYRSSRRDDKKSRKWRRLEGAQPIEGVAYLDDDE